jgi:hypothetical protein
MAPFFSLAAGGENLLLLRLLARQHCCSAYRRKFAPPPRTGQTQEQGARSCGLHRPEPPVLCQRPSESLKRTFAKSSGGRRPAVICQRERAPSSTKLFDLSSSSDPERKFSHPGCGAASPSPSLQPSRFIRSRRDRLTGSCAVLRCPGTPQKSGRSEGVNKAH